MNPRPFIKMHGLGNDFVVVDARMEPFVLDDDAARAVADRRAGPLCGAGSAAQRAGRAEFTIMIK